jgi:condensin complex subunit 2
MPRLVRPARKAEQSDSEEESTDVEATPKAKKTSSGAGNSRLKRRVSQYHPGNEDEAEQRIPLKPFNDELTEKRALKRRKSSRMTMAFDAGAASQDDPATQGDASNSAEGPKTPRKTALARANQLKSVAVPGPMAPVPLEIMTSNFEEWMKMATDNVMNRLF